MSGIALAAGIGLAGGVGAVLRFVVDGEVRRRLPGPTPWGTFVVNVTGCLVLGLVTGLLTGPVAVVLGTGLCGGYTTFSTAVLEVVRFREQRLPRRATAYAVGSLVAGTAAAALGLLLTG